MIENRVKSVLFMGNYNEDYSRNAIFIKTLKKHNITVHKFKINTYHFLKNMNIILNNFTKIKKLDFDLIILHSPTIPQLIYAKYLSKAKKVPLIHDIFVSKLQTVFYDRNLYERNKMPRIFYLIFYYLLDFFECFLADCIILDTYTHIKFFHEKFKVPIKKFRRVLVGAQNDIFYPMDKKDKGDMKLIVGFCGTYIPLHGIKYIIKTANIFRNDNQIKFILIGKGQTYEQNKELAERLKINNIEFIPKFFSLKELPYLISEFDIGLGIFGDGDKVLQVIPNKIFEGIAMKIPMITCESPAIKELFNDNENIILCKRADPESLANAIIKLKKDYFLREKIKENAYKLFNRFCSIDAIGKRFIIILNKLLLD
ncbi:MAG: glycosyltransferase [Promethearchaeota archaeon]